MKRRILLADDSVTIQKVIELTFMDEDYEVRAVSNGDEAVALLSEIKPDFVIADVHMPGANGYEVCRRAKQLRPDLPVLLLVGTFEPFDEAEARTAGADSHLKKPFDSQELLQRVEELIAAKGPSPAPVAAPAPAPAPSFAPPPPPPAPAPLADWTAQATPTPDWLAQPAHEFAAPAPPPTPAPTPDWLAEPAHELAAPAPPPAAVPKFPAEPAWSHFELEPEPAPSPFAAPAPPAEPAHLEPFDHEPAFSLEPEPGFQAEPEPVFELEESEESFTVREDLFGAPSELSLDEPPQDRYLAEEPAPAPAAAGFNWSVEPEPLHPETPTASWELAAPPPELQWSEPEPLSAAPEAFAAPEPFAAPAPEPAYPPGPTVAAAEPAAAHAAGNGHLSDDDVDRIARRVVELLGDRTVRDVAWEVIPDMAEVIIRDRLRELEAQVE